MKKGNPDPVLEWLLDPASPGVRYLALRDLVGLPANDRELISAKKAAHKEGPIAAILAEMHPDGYWSKPGTGYNPKYFSGVWSLILLSQVGAMVTLDERIRLACDSFLEKSMTRSGQFTTSGGPGGTIDCLQGNMCAALVRLGCDPERLVPAYEWMARTVTGEGMVEQGDKEAPRRYYAYKCGPLFACGINNQKPCAWGATKVMLAFSAWPVERRTPLIKRAIRQGAEFLLDSDPALADYPNWNDGKPNRSWWKFGFPVFYVTDILQILEALVALGYGNDPRLVNALDLVRKKADEQGRWSLEYTYNGKTWVDFGTKNQPNPWVTLRALRVLQAVGGGEV